MTASNQIKLSINTSLVQKLIASQFPQWANFPIKPIKFDGWDNRTFHLGEHMTVRLPSAEAYSPQVEKEHHWLPILRPYLPLPIPVPLAIGLPGEGYPWNWSIYQWIKGDTASLDRIVDLPQFAIMLAKFLKALHQIDAGDGPVPGPHNFYRGGDLRVYEAETHQAVWVLKDTIDTHAVKEVWQAALSTNWNNPPVWVHGDINVGNPLVDSGKLNAVIDFGCLGVGDPACDLSIAWTFFSGASREAFKNTLSLDEGNWARARGWTLWKALIVMAQLPGANPAEIERSRQIINEVLAEYFSQKN